MPLLLNMEPFIQNFPLAPLLLNMETLIQFVSTPIHYKISNPCTPVTKSGTPYAWCLSIHSLQNKQPLAASLQNAEALISWPFITKQVTPWVQTLILWKSETLISKQLKPKITTTNGYFESCKCFKKTYFHYWKPVHDCSLLRYYQLLHKSLYWCYFPQFCSDINNGEHFGYVTGTKNL